MVPRNINSNRKCEGSFLTLLEPQSRSGDNPVRFQVFCPQNGTAVLKGLIYCLPYTPTYEAAKEYNSLQ